MKPLSNPLCTTSHESRSHETPDTRAWKLHNPWLKVNTKARKKVCRPRRNRRIKKIWHRVWFRYRRRRSRLPGSDQIQVLWLAEAPSTSMKVWSRFTLKSPCRHKWLSNWKAKAKRAVERLKMDAICHLAAFIRNKSPWRAPPPCSTSHSNRTNKSTRHQRSRFYFVKRSGLQVQKYSFNHRSNLQRQLA